MERAIFLEPGDPWPAAEAWERVYFGAESCPWLLPTVDEARRAMEEARNRGKAFTLVTPFIPQDAAPAAQALLAALSGEGGLEVAVNDWGLLEMIRERGWDFTPLLGRLLVKGSAALRPAEESAAAYLFANSLHSPLFLSFLREAGIRRVEVDRFTMPPLNAGDEAPPAAYHHPWGFVTVAARCPWRFDGRAWSGGPCPRICRGGAFTLIREEDQLAVDFRERGQFIRFSDLPPDLAARGVDRLVLHDLPEAV